ncbi:hypothetical protein [Thalassotalea sp. ND16A]|uniref:hypothetical protein n=1 Tax=Thalassotalea sp. ND16A TaxID=1535422 RepID=UPI00051D7B77|nr:hypothetical protein [Thalassotalea sp. ND16A]KGJ88723.1 hypothetical protein ND16A_2425 [Thalassotalea sp. ND16A]
MKYPAILLTTVLASALNLAGCGGGSGSGNDDDPINEPTPGLMQSDSNPTAGSSTELILLQPNQDISQISWQQTSGPVQVTLLSSSKVVAFTIPVSGDYSFKVDYLDGFTAKSESISFSASSGSNKVVARLGHSVVEQGGVSLRAFTSNDIDTSSITWQQLSGPQVSFDVDNTNTAVTIFDVPSVSADSVIELEVTAKTTAGDTHKDRVSLLIENRPSIVSGALFDDALANIHAYNPDSAFADALIKCVYSNQIENKISTFCELSELPILANTSNGSTPSIEQIMDRVVVSHDWMAENFRAYLEAFDNQDDFKNLLRATTAIVLSYDVRPSFYWAATGAIYLDPNNYWLTAEQRDTINEAPDYRANLGDDLQFIMPWRYVKENKDVSFNYPVNDRLNRSLVDMKFELADLLYHELAHANDYLPPAEWSSVSPSDSFYEAATDVAEISDDMIIRYPLLSQEMKDLAAVRFTTEKEANDIQKAYTPDDVATFYKDDIANGFYNYTNEKEDLGILFESLMMSLRYGVQRDTAVTTPPDPNPSKHVIVAWGQRGRIAEPGISERAAYVTGRLLPEFDLDLIDSLPSPIQMTPGLDWWENLAISPNVPQALHVLLQKSSNTLQPKFRTHQHHARPMPKH